MIVPRYHFDDTALLNVIEEKRELQERLNYAEACNDALTTEVGELSSLISELEDEIEGLKGSLREQRDLYRDRLDRAYSRTHHLSHRLEHTEQKLSDFRQPSNLWDRLSFLFRGRIGV